MEDRLTAMLAPALVAVGTVSLAFPLYRLLKFIHFYLLRRSTVHEFLHGPPAYALVTGASDGIGKSVAQELFDKGFNLILHGRNEEKLTKFIEALCARRQGSDIRYFIADAAKSGHDYARIIDAYKDLNITIVLHNVGGTYLTGERIDGFSESELLEIIHWNDSFALLLTRALLPQLRASAKHGPVTVEFIGSQSALASPPRLPVYAASKAFLEVLARGLDNDERVWDGDTGVRFAHLLVGEVKSNSYRVPDSWARPDADRFAKSLVAKMGCGRRSYTPYMPHAIIAWVAGLLPDSVVDRATAQAMAGTVELAKKNT